jgi:hypothetical protein
MELGGDEGKKKVDTVGKTVVDEMVGTEGEKGAGPLLPSGGFCFGFRVSGFGFHDGG